jgi:hypothetical protein
LGLFYLITLWAAKAKVAAMLHPRSAAWYEGRPDLQRRIATSDACYERPDFINVPKTHKPWEFPPPCLLQRLTEAICYAT